MACLVDGGAACTVAVETGGSGGAGGCLVVGNDILGADVLVRGACGVA